MNAKVMSTKELFLKLRTDPVRDPFVDDMGFEKVVFQIVTNYSGIIYKLYARQPGFENAMDITIRPMIVTKKEPYFILAPTKWLIAGMMSVGGNRCTIGFVELGWSQTVEVSDEH